MPTACFILLVMCVAFAASFDLGPIIRIAQCRRQCIKYHSVDGTCDWYTSRVETECSECWQNCESLETQWEATKFICEGDEYLRCPACQTACRYRTTRLEEVHLPSSLPAPSRGPIKLGDHDIAVVLHKNDGFWVEAGFYPGSRIPSLRPDTWILGILEDGIENYSWEEWTPTLESLKEGPFVEATLSWHDIDDQLKRQRDLEQKKFNDRVRQFYLEKYGEKVLVEWRDSQDTPIPEDVFRRFFFRRRNDDEGHEQPMKMDTASSNDKSKNYKSREPGASQKTESYVVSWEPETGGLMGNQVVDTESAQISLLPGTKYLVRIASNNGPGSFPIEVDTRPNSVHVWRIKKNIEDVIITYPWAIFAASVSAAIVFSIIILLKMFICSPKKKIDEAEV